MDRKTNRTRPRPSLVGYAAEMLATLWDERRLILGGSLLAAVAVLLVSLLFPRYYRSSATILPELDKNKFAGLAQLQGLANLAGLSAGTTDSRGSIRRSRPAMPSSAALSFSGTGPSVHGLRRLDPLFRAGQGVDEKNMMKL